VKKVILPKGENDGQNYFCILISLERAAQDIIRYLPDKIRFLSEVVCHGLLSLSRIEI